MEKETIEVYINKLKKGIKNLALSQQMVDFDEK